MAFWKFGIALVAVGLGGCQTPGVADYTPSRDTLSYLQQVGGTRVSVGSFGNTPESLADATDTGLFSACSLKVADDPDWTGPSGYIRNALVEELTVGGLYAKQDAPVIEGAIETLSFTRDPVFGGAWDIAVVRRAGRPDGMPPRDRRVSAGRRGILGKRGPLAAVSCVLEESLKPSLSFGGQLPDFGAHQPHARAPAGMVASGKQAASTRPEMFPETHRARRIVACIFKQVDTFTIGGDLGRADIRGFAPHPVEIGPVTQRVVRQFVGQHRG